jgi:trehalose/maltose hydrolase-like predicted phosphorylase
LRTVLVRVARTRVARRDRWQRPGVREYADVAVDPSRAKETLPGVRRRFEAAVVSQESAGLRGLVAELGRHGFEVAFAREQSSVKAILEWLAREGIAPQDVLVVDEGELDPAALLEDQLERRRRGELPVPDASPEWTLAVEGFDRTLERVHETQLTVADGCLGTRGAPLVGDTATSASVLASGVYDGEGAESRLLGCPVWSRLDGDDVPPEPLSRVLDLRSGLLFESAGDCVRAVRFACVARPGTAVLRAEETGGARAVPPLLAPNRRKRVLSGIERGRLWMSVAGASGGVVAAAAETAHGVAPRRLDRLASYAGDPDRLPDTADALAALQSAEEAGFERLLSEQRREWAARWDAADVRIEGDAELQRGVRFTLFQLMASVGETGETALGARGLSGPGYRGHVFWDTDVFVLPFLAATRPRAARTLLEYRVRRLPAARAAARALGRAGARFPWESARTGREVTPSQARLRSGEVIPILTGELEEHIVADVAWGVACYLDWTGDERFLEEAGREVIVETARYWASRVRVDAAGRAHIDRVIGPDEYHEEVDDNAFTNVMARWNLRRAGALPGVEGRERESWLELADSIVDGYDERTGLYEEFAGYFALEPLVIAELAPRRPVTAELLLGRERLRASQVVKQADVLMLHQLVPDEVEPGSLVPNLEFYEPRTAHGSSLSPGIHASLFARAGMLEQAVEALRLTSRIDLDDLTETTASGLHTAAMGSLWQALAFGFAGLRPDGDALRVDPRLAPAWRSLELRVRFHGVPLTVRVEPRTLEVSADSPVRLRLGADRKPFVAPVRLALRGTSWEEVES